MALKKSQNGQIPLEQRKELLRMLQELNGWSSKPSYKRRPLPKGLRSWQRRISAWNAREDHLQKSFEIRWHKRVAAVRKEIYFGTAEKAISMLEELK